MGASDMLGVVALSKQLPSYSDTIDLDLCEKVTKSRNIMRWMEFDYFYLFEASKAKKQGKAVDPIIPYEYLMDFSEWDQITFLDCNRFAVQISKQKKSHIFIFNNIIEAQRFYLFSQKAKINIKEKYKMRKHDIKINVDFCLLYAGQLAQLEGFFRYIIDSIYHRSGITDPSKTFRNFSQTFNNFLIGFNCKTDFPARFMGYFIKIYQNTFFNNIIDIVVKQKLKDTSVILGLINDIKFHEEILKRWNISDMRISSCVKVLETIYIKRYFNDNSTSIIQLFLNLTDPHYTFYKEERKISYIMIDVFNTIKSLVTQIKNIRKDKDFKLTLITFVRRCIVMVLSNMRFISEDEKIKIPLELFPAYINSFLEFQQRLDGLLKFIADNYGIKTKYLSYYFPRKYFKKNFAQIQESTINLYQRLLVTDIKAYFKKITMLEHFNIREFFEEHIDSKLEISNQFIHNFISIAEYAAVYSTINCFLTFISDNYDKDPDDFSLDVYIKKSAELQSKITALKLNDALIKIGVTKILRTLDAFFSENQNLYIMAYNISFGFNFYKDFNKMTGIVNLKQYENSNTKKKIYAFIDDCNEMFKIYEHKSKVKSNVYHLIRVLTRVKIFIDNIKRAYAITRGEISDNEEPEEEEQKPPDTKPMVIPMRYFCYRKTTKQNYGYIKYKYAY